MRRSSAGATISEACSEADGPRGIPATLERIEDLLYKAFDLVEKLGVPLAVAAWLTVFLGSLAMIPVLRRRPLPREVIVPAALVGGLGLAAHLLDYAVTLRISPDLAMEANPIWRIVVDGFGLPIAKAYGLTGKILVSVLSFELFAWYGQTRGLLMPGNAAGFRDFLRAYGRATPRRWGVAWTNLASVFAFVFSLLGPYFFYVVLLNSLEDDAKLRSALPSPIPAIAVYLVLLVVAYFLAGWRAFLADQAARSPSRPG